MEWINQLDMRVLLFINQFAGKFYALDRAVFGLTTMPMIKFMIFYMIFWWMWFRENRAQDEYRQIVTEVYASVFLALIVSRLIQDMGPERLRPIHDGAVHIQMPIGVGKNIAREWSSFPSDHATVSSVLVAGVWRLSWKLGLISGVWALVFVLLPRVYLGLHYPTDILSGATLGLLTVVATMKTGVLSSLCSCVRFAERAYRPWFYSGALFLSYQLITMFDDLRKAGDVLWKAIMPSL